MMKRYLVILICLAISFCSCSKQTTEQKAETSRKGNELFPAKQNGKYGFIDKTGKMVIAPQYDDADKFSEELASVKMGDKWGYIDPTGKLVINAQFEGTRATYGYEPKNLLAFSEGLAGVKVGDKWGYIDKTGQMVIAPQFDGADKFAEGLASVSLGKKEGYIDKTGKMVITPQFETANKFSEGLAFVTTKNKANETESSFIDKTGKEVFKVEPAVLTTLLYYDRMIDAQSHSFSEGLAMMEMSCKDSPDPMRMVPLCKSGYFDKTGKLVIDARFDEASSFSEGLASVRVGEQWGFIDKSGKLMIESQFGYAGDFHEGLASVNKGGQASYMGSFRNFRGGTYGFIDKTGKIVIEPQFESAEFFSNGLVFVAAKDKEGYIDATGKFVYSSPIEKPSPQASVK